MDNIISAIVAAVIFVAFVAGLAHSIAEPPFIVIVAIVCSMMSYDVYQSIKSSLAEGKKAKSEKK